MALQEILAKFTTEVDTSKLVSGQKLVEGFKGAIMSMGQALAGAAIVGGIKNTIDEMVELGSNINDVSTRLGIGSDSLQSWQYAVSQVGGSASDIEPAFKKLASQVSDFDGKASKGADTFKKLGVTLEDGAGKMRPLEDIAEDVGIAIGGLEDPIQKSKLAQDLFGKAGGKLLPLFQDGAEGFQAFNDQFQRLGGGLSADAIAALDDAGDASDNFEVALTGLKAAAVVSVLPALTKLTTGAANLVAMFKKTDSSGTHLRNVMIGIGIAGSAAAAKQLMAWAPLIAALILTGLVVDDLITAWEGGDSVLGDLLDKIFGKGEGKAIFKDIKGDVEELWTEMRKAPDAFSAMEVAMDTVGGGLKKFFSEELPAAIGVATSHMNGTETTWSDLMTTGLDAASAALKLWVLNLKIEIRNAVRGVAREVGGELADVVGAINESAGDAVRSKINKAIGEDEGTAEEQAAGAIQLMKNVQAMQFEAVPQEQSLFDLVDAMHAQTVGSGELTGGTAAAQTVNATSTASANITINVENGDPDSIFAALDASYEKTVIKHQNEATLRALESAKGHQ